METPEFTQVTPHISKLDLPLFAGAMRIGVWLVESDEGWTLVDTASPGDAEAVYRATLARTAGQAPRRIILTHGHYDHAGSLRTLWERWPVPVLVHRAESPFVLGKAGYGSVRPAWWGNRLIQSLAGVAGRVKPVPNVDLVAEGDVIDDLEVRHVPGHAPGMIALIHRGDRAIVAGDTFVSKRGRLHPPPGIFTADPAEAVRSMRALAGEDFDHLLPSHGQPILQTGKAEAEQAVARMVGS